MIASGPADLVLALKQRLAAVLGLLEQAGAGGNAASQAARQAATGLYHATAAALFVREALLLNDPVRADLARLLLAHKLMPRDPLAASPEDDARGDRVIEQLVAARRS